MNKQQTQPIRVLHVLGTTNLGGAESRIMELYRCIDKTQVQFDFLVHTQKEGHYQKEICALGGTVYHVPRFRGINLLSYRKAVKDFFAKHHAFAAVHGHMTSTASIYLPIAKKAGIPSTIAHARSAGVDKGIKGIVTKLLRRSLVKKADWCFACSQEAAVAVFGRKCVEKGKVQVIPNAVDTARFRFRQTVRDAVRRELKLDDKFVIGHVGRFGFMKNHAYLLEVFAALCKLRQDAALILIGSGELEQTVHRQAEELGIADRVLFLGNCYNVEQYYPAFDYFVFPSIFEGLPGSVVEAQACGLRCLVSDKVTREAAVTDLAVYRSIEEPAVLWAQEIQKSAKDAMDRRDTSAEITKKGFDVRQQAAAMTKFYQSGKNLSIQQHNKKKIMLIVPMLYQGGHERICAMTAKLLNNIHEVHLVIFSAQDMIYDVSGVDFIDLNLHAVSGIVGKILNIFKRTRRVRRLKKKLGIEICYSFGPSANIVNVLSKHHENVWAGIRGYGALLDKGIMKLVCKRADCIVNCTKVLEQEIAARFSPKRQETLYNPCDLEEIRMLSKQELPKEFQAFFDRAGKVVASMGREDDVKGFWHLIKSFFLVKKKLPDLKLMIIGEGSYIEYRELARKLSIDQDILFTGVQKNPFPFLVRSDVYALTSDSEGFPNALIETMACHVPCVSVNCKTGPAEILHKDYQACSRQDQVYYADYGILTPIFTGTKNLSPEHFTAEEHIFAQQLEALLSNTELYQKYSKMAAERAEAFSVETYLQKLLNMIQ